MQLCWLPATLRPTVQKVSTLLNYLYDNQDVLSESTNFESRWNALQPVVKEHNLQNTPQHISLKFESDFLSKKDQDSLKDCDSMMSSEFDLNQYGGKSPSSGSFSIGFEADLASDISPSLLNLRGSIEDLIISEDAAASGDKGSTACLSGLKSQEVLSADNSIESDAIEFSINEALKDLDVILAEESTSSDTSKCNTPEKSQMLKNEACDYSKINGDDGISHNVENTILNIPLKSESVNDSSVCVTLSDTE